MIYTVHNAVDSVIFGTISCVEGDKILAFKVKLGSMAFIKNIFKYFDY